MKKMHLVCMVFFVLSLLLFGSEVFAIEESVELILSPSRAVYTEGEIPERGTGAYYRTLGDLLSVVRSGDTILLSENVTDTETRTLTVTQKDIIFELNGYTYRNTKCKTDLLEVFDDAGLVISDRVGNGSIQCVLAPCCIKVMFGGSLRVMSGTISNERSSQCAVINFGKTEIYGGELMGKKAAVNNDSNGDQRNAETIVYDGTIGSTKGSAMLLEAGRIEIFGGYFNVPSGKAIFLYDATLKEQLSIKGGYFTSDISADLTDEDFACDKNTISATLKNYPYVVAAKRTVSVTALSGILDTEGQLDTGHSPGKVLGSGTFFIGDHISLTAPVIKSLKFVCWYQKIDGRWQAELSETCPTLLLEADHNCVWAAGYRRESDASVLLNIEGKHFSVRDDTDFEKTYADSCEVACPFGSEMTVSSMDENRFLYWADSTGKIISETSTVTLLMTKNTRIREISLADSIGKTMLLFLSGYRQLIACSIEDGSQTVSMPLLRPSGSGRIFEGWALHKGEACLTEEDIRDIIVRDHPERIDMIAKDYSSGETCDVRLTLSDVMEEENEKDNSFGEVKKVIVETEAMPEGKKFGYWTDEQRRIRSFSDRFAIRVMRDEKLTGRFLSEDDTMEQIPALTLQISSTEERDEEKVIRVTASRSIPDGFKLLDHGLIYSTDPSAFMETDTQKANILVSPDRENDGALTGIFHFDSASAFVYEKLFCRGYMMVSGLGEQYIIYTDIEEIVL